MAEKMIKLSQGKDSPEATVLEAHTVRLGNGERIVVRRSDYNDMVGVDIRVYYPHLENDEIVNFRPTKRGTRIPISRVERVAEILVDLVTDLKSKVKK